MSRGVLLLPVPVRRALVRDARRASPRECCGFLLGRGRRIAYAAPMPNVARSRTTYRIADRDHIALRRLLRTLTPPIGIIGVFHSHPDGRAEPSPTDLAHAHYPEWIHVIVGLRAPVDVRAFRLARGRATELEVRLISSPT